MRDQYGLSDSYDNWRIWTPDQDAVFPDDTNGECHECGDEYYWDFLTEVKGKFFCDQCVEQLGEEDNEEAQGNHEPIAGPTG